MNPNQLDHLIQTLPIEHAQGGHDAANQARLWLNIQVASMSYGDLLNLLRGWHWHLAGIASAQASTKCNAGKMPPTPTEIAERAAEARGNRTDEHGVLKGACVDGSPRKAGSAKR